MPDEVIESNRYRVLLIEDDKLDQMAFERLVKQQRLPYDFCIADSFSQTKEILSSGKFDIAIVDYNLGDGTGFDVLGIIEDTPIIFATGGGDEEIAVKAMKAGAYDYMIKDIDRNYLKVLPQIVEKAISHKKTKDSLKQYHDNLEILVKQRTEQLGEEKELLAVTLSSMSDGVIAVDAVKHIIIFNKVAENLTGWSFEEVQVKAINEVLQFINEKTKKAVENPIDKAFSTGNTEAGTDRDVLIAKDGSQHPIAATAAPIRKKDGSIIGVVMALRDVSRQRELDRMKTEFVYPSRTSCVHH